MNLFAQNPYSVNPKFRIAELEYQLGTLSMRQLFAGDDQARRRIGAAMARTERKLDAARAAEVKRDGGAQ